MCCLQVVLLGMEAGLRRARLTWMTATPGRYLTVQDTVITVLYCSMCSGNEQAACTEIACNPNTGVDSEY